MDYEFYQKEKITLWHNDACLTFLEKGNSAALVKIQYPDKILIEATLPHGVEFIESLATSFTLELLHKDGRLDVRQGQQQVFTFNNCRLIRKWIPDISSTGFCGGVVVGYFKYRCEIVRHNG